MRNGFLQCQLHRGRELSGFEADPSAGGSVNQVHEQITMCVKGQDAGTYKVLYRYEVGIPVLKGAGDDV